VDRDGRKGRGAARVKGGVTKSLVRNLSYGKVSEAQGDGERGPFKKGEKKPH